MPWKRMLAYITGSVNEDLLRRIEYLLEENRVLRNQVQQRLRLTDSERRTLAEKAVVLGKLMADTVTIVRPETILKWHAAWWPRSLMAPGSGDTPADRASPQNWRNSSCGWPVRTPRGLRPNRRRPPQSGQHICDQTVGNILQRNGLGPHPSTARTRRGAVSCVSIATCCGPRTSSPRRFGRAGV